MDSVIQPLLELQAHTTTAQQLSSFYEGKNCLEVNDVAGFTEPAGQSGHLATPPSSGALEVLVCW